MADNKVDITPDFVGSGSGTSSSGGNPTIGTLLNNIIADVDTIRDNMKGGGLNVKSKDAFVNSEDGTTQVGDTTDDNLDTLATASANLPLYKGKLVNKLAGLGVIQKTTNPNLSKIVEAVEGIDKHNCESFATKQDGQGKYIPLGLGEAWSIPKGYHTGNVRIIAVDDDECENNAHLNIGATKYTAPLPGDANLIINNTSVNRVDSNGNYVYDAQNHIQQASYYGLTSVTIVPPDLDAIATENKVENLADASEVLKGFGFVNKDGFQVGTLEAVTYEVASSDIPIPGTSAVTKNLPNDKMAKAVKINPIPSYYLNISDGGKEVTGTVNLSNMTNQDVSFSHDTPQYVKSINISVVNDIYEKLSKI